jgi:hypothetical protein
MFILTRPTAEVVRSLSKNSDWNMVWASRSAARGHHAVDVEQRVFRVRRGMQRVADVGPTLTWSMSSSGFLQPCSWALEDFSVLLAGFGVDFTGLRLTRSSAILPPALRPTPQAGPCLHLARTAPVSFLPASSTPCRYRRRQVDGE